MKRRWSQQDYRDEQEIRRRRFERRRRQQTAASGVYIGGRTTGRTIVVAPPNLSAFDEPESVIEFCNNFRGKASGRYPLVTLDLGDVERVTSDALLLIRAIMRSSQGVNFRGNLPRKLEVAAKIKASGFFSGFTKPPGDLPPAAGMMHDSSERRVVNTMAAGLVIFALEHATFSQEEAEASYQTLMEVMSNTHHHAHAPATDSAGEPNRWFAMVNCEDDRAFFTIADLGVGILKSRPAQHFLKEIVQSRLGFYGAERLLRDAFEGRVGSSTGIPGRGKGLPRMHEDAVARLHNLRVLTSTFVGPVKTLEFRRLPAGFRGTVFNWTVGNRSFV
jgi:hypothetical protein